MSETDWLEKANSHGVYGFLHPSEAERLVELATGHDVLEIGAFQGLSAWCMAHVAKSIVSVDPHTAWTNGTTMGEEFTTLEAFKANLADFPNVTCFVGTSEMAGEQIEGDFDMVFVDGSHEYEFVRDDIARWWPRIREGGLMVFHDYGHGDYPGVTQAINEAFEDLGEYNPPMDDWIVTLRTVWK